MEIVIVGSGFDPKTLVEEAANRKELAAREAEKQKDSYLNFDGVWCVFDIDQRPKERRVPEARAAAKKSGINLGISNPCFELWALLHFQDYNKPDNQQTVTKALKKFLPKYAKQLPYEELAPNYLAAVKRATQSERNRYFEGTPNGNPSTTVYKLTEAIRRFGKR